MVVSPDAVRAGSVCLCPTTWHTTGATLRAGARGGGGNARVGGAGCGGRVGGVTETTEATVIAEALNVIDRALAQVGSRELVSSAEMSDLLLDLRLLLMSAEVAAPPASVGEGSLPA